MQLTREEQCVIADKAKSLLERMEEKGNAAPLDDPKIQKKIDARLKEWREMVAEGDDDLFSKRLALDGLDLETARKILNPAPNLDGQSPPAWTDDLNEILDAVARFPVDKFKEDFVAEFKYLKKDEPQPFEEVLIPIVQLGRKKLEEKAGAKCQLLSDKAHRIMERFLLFRLSEVSSRVLEVEFNTFMACLQFSGVSYNEVTHDKNSRKHYLGFVEDLHQGQLASIFKEYSVLARMLVLRVNQWVQLTIEFLERLESDLPEIADAFLKGKKEIVEELEPGLSDPHCDGRTVIILTFASKTKVVYKPKEMGLEVGYFQLADWLNSQGIPLDFKVLNVIERDSYGWVEFIEHTPMDDREQASRFFRRSGILLGLLFAVDGIDFHSENVVAAGEYPVPIDMETFFHHQVKYPKDIEELTSAANMYIADSVLKTHFLPQLYKMRDKFMDITGMGAVPGEEVEVEVLKWKNMNTDAMAYNFDKMRPPGSKNAPKIGEEYLTPEDFTEEIVDGFQWMVNFIIEKKETFLEEGSPFVGVFRHSSRFVFRATALYASLLRKVTHPDYQRDGIDLGIQLDILSRPLVPMDEKSEFWPLIAVEEKEMYEQDVPKFIVPGTCDYMELADGTRTRTCFSGSPLELTKKKINELTEKDIAWQVQLIQGSMEARQMAKANKSAPLKKSEPLPQDVKLLTQDQLIENATLLAKDMLNNAIYTDVGEPSWVTVKPIPGSDQFMLDAMQHDLYTGNTGPALFLAALYQLEPDPEFKKQAYNSIALMRRWLKKARPSDISETGIGGITGLGSMVYSLIRFSQLMDDAEILEEAKYAATLFNRKDIDDDKQLDLLGGSAGTIVTLMALYKETHDKEIIDLANYCAQHLLKNRVTSKQGIKTWKCVESSPPLAGFSHGAAGIAYAFLKIYRETGNIAYLDAAKEAISYETEIFDPQAKNWPDYRSDEKNNVETEDVQYMSAWCNGAPGIGLGRLASLNILDTESIRADIRNSLENTRDCDFQERDHLCCGNAGRAEIMLHAGIKLDQPEWKQEALGLTSQIIHRSRKNGELKPGFLFSLYNPTLFQGAAGMGYHLVRLAEPERFPSILALE